MCFIELANNTILLSELVGASEDIVEQLNGIKVEVLPWKEDNEVDYIRSFDIGIMPLEDGPGRRVNVAIN